MENKTPNSALSLEEGESLGLDIKKAVARFIDHWKLLTFSVGLMILLGYVYLRCTTSKYKINATLMIQDPQKGSSMFGDNTGGNDGTIDISDLFGTKSSVDNEAQVLQTSDLTLKVSRDLQLYLNYKAPGGFNDTDLYARTPIRLKVLSNVDSLRGVRMVVLPLDSNRFQIHERDGDEITYTVRSGYPFVTGSGDTVLLEETGYPLERKAYRVNITSLADAAEALEESLSVVIPNKQVSTINLILKNSRRDRGVLVLNTLISEYIRGNIEQKNAFADSTIDFINNRISIVDQELSGIEKKVQNFKEDNHIADLKAQSDELIGSETDSRTALTQAEVQQQIAESAIKYLEDSANNHRPVPSLLQSPDPTFLLLLDKYNTLQVEADKLALSSTANNPMMRNLDNQIAGLRHDILTNLKNQLSGIKLGVAKLESQQGTVNAFIREAPAKERAFMGLSREQDIKQALFIYLLQKKEEVAVTKASNITSCSVIDSPKAEKDPYFPRKSLIMLMCVLAGIALPYGGILFRDMLDNKVSGNQDLTHAGAVSLGEVGHSNLKSTLVFPAGARSVIAEQFRAIRTNLQFVLGEKECPVILVTSSVGHEGKSFICSNLAMAYASNQKKVLLMELDLRKPKLSRNFEVHSETGFSNYVISSIAPEDIIVPTEVSPYVHLLPSGPIPPNPSELLSNPKTRELIAHLRGMYDYILIDSAPLGLVADAQLLAPLADLTIYVVRQHFTLKQQTNIIRDQLESGKIPRLYTVLNDVRIKASSRYGYGYVYGQTSGYGYGYGYWNGNGQLNGKKQKTYEDSTRNRS